MKTISKISIITMLVISMVACSDDFLLEKPSSYYDANNYFTSVEKAEMALLGIYDVLAKIDHYGQYEMPVQTSDGQYSIRGTATDNTRRDISHYMVTPSNVWVEAIWKWKYTGIDRANYFLENLRQMELYKEGREELKRYEGEASFLRALLAFDLVRYWGDVPFKTTYSQSATDGIIPRTDRMAIYDQIITDLNLAKQQLPWAQSGSSSERITQGAARALLMRVYLHKAGYSLKMDGTLTKPDESVRQNCFSSVIEEFNQFQTNGFHGLNASYEQLWKNYCEKVIDPQESLFEISFFSPDGSNEDSGNWGTYIGPETDANSSYGRANAFFVINSEWFDYYLPADVRRDVNICRYKVDKNDNRVNITNKTQWTPGKWRREWIKTAPKNPNNTDVNYVYLRYADVLLMAAEALNETGRSSEAVPLINQVRVRAGVPELEVSLGNYETLYKTARMAPHNFIDDSDQAGKIRRALYWERGFELCYEGVRKYDLLRWGILDQVLKSIPKSTNYIANEKFMTGKHELLPVPLREIELNNAFGGQNNPGY